MYRCPTTGEMVQHLVEADLNDKERFEAVECPACSAVHFVKPANGKVLGVP